MNRLDLKCIKALLPAILEKSSKEDIRDLEKLIEQCKYGKFDKPWLSYFDEDLPQWLSNKLDPEHFPESNRIKDLRTIRKTDKLFIYRTQTVVGNDFYGEQIHHFNLTVASNYKVLFSYSPVHCNISYIVEIDVRRSETYNMSCMSDIPTPHDGRIYLYKLESDVKRHFN